MKNERTLIELHKVLQTFITFYCTHNIPYNTRVIINNNKDFMVKPCAVY